ncbi:MAG: L,D-transpeptidase family protein [Woeseiaceae bacterium]|nr:L,D-transpeptidase family protein [Woeseiaceae bacterium]
MRISGTLITVLLLLWQGSLHAGAFPLAERVIVDKSERKLHLLRDGESFRIFDIALGIRPIGDKQHEGDFKTPEGLYRLDVRNPNSEYFLSIHVSYPNGQDVREARSRGLDPGGAIMIHGQPNVPTRSEAYYRTQNWTNGCIAVSNSDMIDIWLMTDSDTPIEIQP